MGSGIRNTCKLFVFFGLILLGAMCFAKPSVEDYAALPNISNVSISPSGELIAFLKRTEKGKRIYVYSVKEKRLIAGTRVDDLNITGTEFINETKVIFTGYDYRKIYRRVDAWNISTAFMLDVKTQNSWQILQPGDGIHLGQSGLGRVVGITPDGKYMLMPAYVENERGGISFSLTKVRIDKKSKPRVVRNGARHTRDYFVDAKGEPIVEERLNDKSNEHTIWSRVDGKWKVIYRHKAELSDISAVGLTEDYKHLVVLDEAPKTGTTSYYKMSLRDGSLSESVYSRPDADVEGVIIDKNRIVTGVRYSGFLPSYEFNDNRKAKTFEQLTKMFPDHAVYMLSVADSNNSWVVKIEGPTEAGGYYFTSNGKLTKLGQEFTGVSKKDIHPIISSGYKARDGLYIPALLTVPKEKYQSLSNLPAVVLPHGGPESYDKKGFHWIAQALANEGYVVLQPQFRGSSGFGLKFRQKGDGEWGNKMQDDVTDGLQLLVNEGIVDQERVCIVGGSYGGYSALAGGAYTPDLYKCVVSLNGVADLPKMLREEKFDHGSDSWIVSYWNRELANGEPDKNKLKSISPARNPEKFRAPVLLLHGENDTVVDIAQSKYMHKQLKKAGKQSTFIKLEGESHWLTTQSGRLEALKAIVNFVNLHIGS